ncbi:hypothetical protein BC834DRAFT_432837 [Gloeopeniophorella convolvens]|nr:hypothetical protein BC834DRAFT_432837 [Gloeopeniophorella convolvens]
MSRLDSLVQQPQTSSDSAVYRSHRSDRGSPRTGSDDGASYNHRRPSTKTDQMAPEDTQLTSQALNTDGTPRRPMNAFMIFARRRRPQVSAANQTMRTGDISKILSKEWNSMDMSDKQFYLDQAKRLKETFNSKYPDYVYRRRPNNSRKKRRSDATANPLLDASASGDAGDDFSAAQDFDYQSVDGHDPAHLSARDLAPSRGSSHPGVASGYEDNAGMSSPHPTLSPYSYPTTDYAGGHILPSGTRLPSIHDHPPPESSSLASLPPHHYTDTTSSSGAYASDHIAGSSFWGNASAGVRGDHGRTLPSAWASAPPLIPPLNVGGIRERPTPAQHNKSETLSSPFFPASHSPGAYQSSASSSSTPSGSPENYYSPATQLQSGSFGGRAGGYDQPNLYGSHPVPHSSASPSSLHSLAFDPGMPSLATPSSSSDSYTSSSLDHWRAKVGGQ